MYASGWMLFSGDSSCSSVVTPVPTKERKRQLGELAALLDVVFINRLEWMLPLRPRTIAAHLHGARSLTRLHQQGGRLAVRCSKPMTTRGTTGPLHGAASLTRQHQHRGQAAVLAKQHVGVEAVAAHADLQAHRERQERKQLSADTSVGVQQLADVKPAVKATPLCSLPSLLAIRFSHVRQTSR